MDLYFLSRYSNKTEYSVQNSDMTDKIKFAILLRFRPDFGPFRNREQEEPQAERCSNQIWIRAAIHDRNTIVLKIIFHSLHVVWKF